MTGVRRVRRLVPIALGLVGVLPALVFACTSSNTSLLGGPTTQSGNDASATEDGATTTPVPDDAPTSFIVDSAPPDTFVPLNAVDGSDRPEGGIAVQSGVITCVPGAPCDAFASNQCCVGGAQGLVCQAASVSCGPGAASVTCNESADCEVGKVCCGSLAPPDSGIAALGAQCASSCPAPPHPQLCRTNGECAEAGPCVVQKCSDGNTYELCGVYTSPDDGGTFNCSPQ